MKQKTKTQLDYTAYEVGNQLQITLECDVRVPKDDPVRLLSAVLDRIDYSLRIKSQAQNEEKRGRNDEVNNKQATRRGDQKKGCVVQPSHRVKDRRLRRACGILDTACCQC